MNINLKDRIIAKGLDYEIAKTRMQKLGILSKPKIEMRMDKTVGMLNGGKVVLSLTKEFEDHINNFIGNAMANNLIQKTKEGFIVINEDYFFVLENAVKSYKTEELSDLDDLYIFVKIIDQIRR